MAPMAAYLVDRMAILVAFCRFHGMGIADSRSLRCDSYVRMHNFVRRSSCVPFRRYLGNVRREFLLKRISAGILGSYLLDDF
jgi:hypothetical protein